MPVLFSGARLEVYDDNGIPVNGALVNFYAAGTSTRKNTFSDAELSIPNDNPVVADAAGRCGPIYLNGLYKVIVKDSFGDPIYSQDNYSAYFNENPIKVATIAAMTALASDDLVANDIIVVADPDRGGLFQVIAGSTTADNGITFSPDDAGAIHFKRIYNGLIFPEWYDATGDGSANDTTAISALETAGAGGLKNGSTYLTTLTALAADYYGDGKIVLASPARAVQPLRPDGSVLPLPSDITDVWTPDLNIVRKNGKWSTDKSVRHLIPSVTGSTYYVDNMSQVASGGTGKASTITGATKADPVVITYSGTDHPTNDQYVRISGVVGMVEINDRYFRVANRNTTAKTFELLGIDGTGFTTYSSGGQFVEPLSKVSDALTKTDVSQILIAPSVYNQFDGVGSTTIATSSDGIIIRPWRIRSGRPVLTAGANYAYNAWAENATYGGVWEATITGTADTLRCFDLTQTGPDGQWMEYERIDGGTWAQTLSAMTTRPGTWSTDGTKLAISPILKTTPTKMSHVFGTASANTITPDCHIHIEDMIIGAAQYGFRMRNTTSTRYKFTAAGCTFFGATTENNLYIHGAFEVYHEDCDEWGAMLDGFNYHAWSGTDVAPYAFEVRARGGGSISQSNESCNFSTVHDGSTIIRVDCAGGFTAGPVFADVGGSLSFNVDCKAGVSVLGYGHGSNVGFYQSESKMWLVDCDPGGSSISLSSVTSGFIKLLNTNPRGTYGTDGTATIGAYV